MKWPIANVTTVFNIVARASAVLMVFTLNACFDSSTEEAPPSVNLPPSEKPLISNDTLSVPPDMSGVVDVLSNDQSADGSTLTVEDFDEQSVEGGTVLQNDDGTFTYTPPPGFPPEGEETGQDSFMYTVKTSKGAAAVGTVAVTVSHQVIPNGKAFYADNCAICHSLGSDDTTGAFESSDLSQKASLITRDMRDLDSVYDLMGTFYSVPQVNVDELRAYIKTAP